MFDKSVSKNLKRKYISEVLFYRVTRVLNYFFYRV